MASKEDIINNLREYTSVQIVEAIKAGTVTIYELSKSGKLTPLMRRRIEDKLTSQDEVESPSQSDTSVSNQESENSKMVYVYVEKQAEIPQNTEEDLVSDVVIPQAPVDTSIEESSSSSIQDSENAETKPSISNKGMFNRPYSFNGRIRRLEYGISFIGFGYMEYTEVEVRLSSNANAGELILYYIIDILVIWFLFAQNCKRCHDRGNSGWYQLIPFYFFVLLFGDGEKGTNEYGDNPKN